jgi:sucrose-phosphate synthase
MPYVYRYAARKKWIFINPAFHEPFGLTVIEAMASGLPVIATKHGGPSEILDAEKYGLLIDPSEPASIQESLIKLLDPAAWEKYSKKGMERICAKYNWNKAALGRIDLIKKVIDTDCQYVDEDFDIPGYFLEPDKSSDKDILENVRKWYGIQEI